MVLKRLLSLEKMLMRIILADDHKLVREGILALIGGQSDFAVIAEAENGNSAVALAAELKPDIVLMDISMPDITGIEATRLIRAHNADIKVLILSMYLDIKKILDSFDAGASGYLLKDCAFEEVIHAMRTVCSSNEMYLSPMIAETVLKAAARAGKNGDSEIAKLTPREREVFQHLAEGKNTKETAEHFQFSIKTAEFHRNQIMAKLGVRNIVELTRLAIRAGVTPL